MGSTTVLQDEPLVYTLRLDETDDRLDCAWSNPHIQARVQQFLDKRAPNMATKDLIDLGKVRGGKRLPAGTLFVTELPDSIPYIRVGDVNGLQVNVDNAARISRKVHRTIQNYQLHKNDLVFSIVGTIGRAGLVTTDDPVINFTENLARIHLDKPGVLPEFILHALDSELVQVQTDRMEVGSLQYKLSLDSCRKLQVLIPSDGDKYDHKRQQAILDEFNNYLHKARKLRKEAKQLVTEAQTFVEKTLGQAVQDEANVPREYHARLDESSDRLDFLYLNPGRQQLIEDLTKHPHAKLKTLIKEEPPTRIPYTNYYRVIDQEQVDDKTGRITEYQELPMLGSSKRLLKHNCLIISKMQSKYGKVALVQDEFAGCVASSEFLQYSLLNPKTSLEYIWAILRSRYVLAQWGFVVSGSSRMRINPKDIAETIIPLPGKPIQDKIVTEIGHRLDRREKLLHQAEELEAQAKQYFLEALTVNR